MPYFMQTEKLDSLSYEYFVGFTNVICISIFDGYGAKPGSCTVLCHCCR
jgi:hypothetical protein